MSLLVLALTFTANAEECDAKALKTSVEEASPIAIPKAWKKLVECDEATALEAAPATLDRTLAGRDSHEMIASIVSIGGGKEVRAWLDKQEPDKRSGTINHLGEQCKGNENVEKFFVQAHADLGGAFWEDRWYRGLADCRTDGIQKLLTTALDDPKVGKEANDRQVFFGLLEVYARNLGAAAIPTLDALVAGNDDATEVGPLIAMYGDTANVGSTEGTNPDAAAKAVASIDKRGPELPPKAVDQARDTLIALGSQEIADGFAKYRWPDRFQPDGKYTYYAVATEDVTCKNGKKQVWFHHGPFTEPGSHWPAQIAEGLDKKLLETWSLEAATKCKGEGTVTAEMSKAPLEGGKVDEEWLTTRRQAYLTASKDAWKSGEMEHEAFEW